MDTVMGVNTTEWLISAIRRQWRDLFARYSVPADGPISTLRRHCRIEECDGENSKTNGTRGDGE